MLCPSGQFHSPAGLLLLQEEGNWKSLQSSPPASQLVVLVLLAAASGPGSFRNMLTWACRDNRGHDHCQGLVGPLQKVICPQGKSTEGKTVLA